MTHNFKQTKKLRNGFSIQSLKIAPHPNLTAQTNGNIAESAIDHVYSNKNMSENIHIQKINTGSSDYIPIIVKIQVFYLRYT